MSVKDVGEKRMVSKILYVATSRWTIFTNSYRFESDDADENYVG